MGKLKDGLDGLGAAVEDNGVAHFFALEGDIDRCLSRNGEKGLLRKTPLYKSMASFSRSFRTPIIIILK